MKSKPSLERPSGTGWTGKAAKHAAGSMTRRGALCRLGYAAAAILGANFLLADGPKAHATVVAKPPCQLDTKSPCNADGLYCGMQKNAGDCKGYAQCSGCIQANGCPQGTSPEGSWTACCLCPGSTTTGLYVTMQDCCGTITVNGKCWRCAPVYPGCTNETCTNNSCLGMDWCDYLVSYACTLVTVGGKCAPAA